MKKLLLHFLDTQETLTLDEDSPIFAWGPKNAEGQSTCYILDFDEGLPEFLREKALMFYVYDDVPILKLYRSVYISKMEWI